MHTFIGMGVGCTVRKEGQFVGGAGGTVSKPRDFANTCTSVVQLRYTHSG